MSKAAVIYWSQTGNTEAMAQAVCEGAKAAGAEVDLLTCADVTGVPAIHMPAADSAATAAQIITCPRRYAPSSSFTAEAIFSPSIRPRLGKSHSSRKENASMSLSI